MKSETSSAQPQQKADIPPGYRIIELRDNERPKFILQTNILGVSRLSCWRRVKKKCINIVTTFHIDQKFDYKDQNGRKYIIVNSDGNCRNYEEAVEFLKYVPLKKYMQNEQGLTVHEVWANDRIARNFLGAGVEPNDIGRSRIGLFLSDLTDAHFEPKTDYWEDFFIKHYKMEKISS